MAHQDARLTYRPRIHMLHVRSTTPSHPFTKRYPYHTENWILSSPPGTDITMYHSKRKTTTWPHSSPHGAGIVITLHHKAILHLVMATRCALMKLSQISHTRQSVSTTPSYGPTTWMKASIRHVTVWTYATGTGSPSTPISLSLLRTRLNLLGSRSHQKVSGHAKTILDFPKPKKTSQMFALGLDSSNRCPTPSAWLSGCSHSGTASSQLQPSNWMTTLMLSWTSLIVSEIGEGVRFVCLLEF